MGFFHGYFDESGKIQDPVVAFCGFVAPIANVQAFESEWNGILRSYEMECLSMKRAFKATAPLSRVIRKQSFAERIDTLKPFADCIRKHLEFGIATSIDVQAYKAIPVRAKKNLGGSNNPHFVVFLAGVMATLRHLRSDDKISLICDDDEETALDCYKFYRRVRKIHEGCRRRFVSLTFADDASFPMLQAADMLAGLVRMRSRFLFYRTPNDYVPLFNYLTDPQPHFKWGVSIWGKDELAKFDRPPIKE